jgi:hypothetical protein
MARVLGDAEVEHDMLVRQDAALARLVGRDFASLVVGFARDVLAAPRLTSVNVAPGFWRQFALAEELETIRASRPSAFRALPVAPDDTGLVADLGHRK